MHKHFQIRKWRIMKILWERERERNYLCVEILLEIWSRLCWPSIRSITQISSGVKLRAVIGKRSLRLRLTVGCYLHCLLIIRLVIAWIHILGCKVQKILIFFGWIPTFTIFFSSSFLIVGLRIFFFFNYRFKT